MLELVGGSREALVQQVQVDDKLQVQEWGVLEWEEEQVQDDMHQSLVQVDGTLQVLQVDQHRFLPKDEKYCR